MWLGKFISMLLASKEAECPSFHFILSSLKKNILYVWHLIPSIFLWLLFLIYAPFTNHVHYIRFACFQCVDCRFAYFLADVDVFLKQVVDCRPEGQKRCFLHFRGTLPHPPSSYMYGEWCWFLVTLLWKPFKHRLWVHLLKSWCLGNSSIDPRNVYKSRSMYGEWCWFLVTLLWKPFKQRLWVHLL